MPIINFTKLQQVPSNFLDDIQAKIHSILKPGLLGGSDLLEPTLSSPDIDFSQIPEGEAVYSEETFFSELKDLSISFDGDDPSGTYKIYIDSYLTGTGGDNPYYQARLRMTLDDVDEDQYLVVCLADWDKDTTTLSNLVDLRSTKWGVLGPSEDDIHYRHTNKDMGPDQRRLVPSCSWPHGIDPINGKKKTIADTGSLVCGALLYLSGYLYAATHNGSQASTFKVLKIDIVDFSVIDEFESDSSPESCYALCSDGTFIYAAESANDPIVIYKIDPVDMSKISAFTGNSGESGCPALACDGTYLYAGFALNPCKIIKIATSTMQRDSDFTGASGEDDCLDLLWDNEHLYAALETSPYKVLKIDTSTMTKDDDITGGSGDNDCVSLAFDGMNLYAGLNINPWKVIKIDPDTMTEITDLSGSVSDLNKLLFTGREILACVGPNAADPDIAKIRPDSLTVEATMEVDDFSSDISAIAFDGSFIFVAQSAQPYKILRRPLMS